MSTSILNIPQVPVFMSVWRHLKTNSIYVVLGTAICSTNGETHGEESVIYRSNTTGRFHYRMTSEFLDGRFVREA